MSSHRESSHFSISSSDEFSVNILVSIFVKSLCRITLFIRQQQTLADEPRHWNTYWRGAVAPMYFCGIQKTKWFSLLRFHVNSHSCYLQPEIHKSQNNKSLSLKAFCARCDDSTFHRLFGKEIILFIKGEEQNENVKFSWQLVIIRQKYFKSRQKYRLRFKNLPAPWRKFSLYRHEKICKWGEWVVVNNCVNYIGQF